VWPWPCSSPPIPEEALALEIRHVRANTLLVQQRNIAGTIVVGQKVRGFHPRAVDWVEPARRDGTRDWPTDRTRPQASVEFDVVSREAVEAAADELERAGFELVHPARQEPWGQTVARVISSEGLIVGVSYVPSMHQ
jgi:hypothetical protein